MKKSKTYVQLLKEAIAEFDTSDNVEVKGPMLDPILSWRGDGELPTNKDAASILERYYFNEGEDKPLETAFENDKGDASGEAMDHAEGTGTEQAGTSDESSIKGALDDKEEIIAKEWIEGMIREQDEDSEEDEEDKEEEEVEEGLLFLEQDHDEDKETPEEEAAESEETQKKEKEEGTEKHDVKEAEDVEDKDDDDKEDKDDSEKMTENAIIEKLIGEMEEKDGIMTYTDDEPKVHNPEEKEAKGPMDHAEGSGTEQAGTGDAEGQIPDRKDLHDQMVEPKEYTDESLNIEQALEQLELNLLGEAEEAEEDEDESEKKVDVEEGIAGSIAGGAMGAAVGHPVAGAAMGHIAQKKLSQESLKGPAGKMGHQGEDYSVGEYAEEGFKIFKEEIENEVGDTDKVEEISSKRVRV
jgi:hypothetical protein